MIAFEGNGQMGPMRKAVLNIRIPPDEMRTVETLAMASTG
jgi:hypothetical protein